jgi:SHS2 domain-containing protein
MAGPVYRWVDHTSELELEIGALSERGVLIEGLHALAELLEGDSSPSEHERRTVVASAHDRPALLAAWLEELVFLAETDSFIALEVEQMDIGAEQVAATVAGPRGEPRPIVKAVTYHRLEFEGCGRGYRGRVVFDV